MSEYSKTWNKLMELDPDAILALIMVFVCVLCAALAAGLTIGLVSIDKNELNLILINGTHEEKRQARAILPILKDHHWLLVTLFLFNAMANEALPLFLDDLLPQFASVIIATFMVLIFGEIIPSSVFSGRNQMKLAASLSGVVYVLMALFYPVARPIGLFLDHWLGRHDIDAHQAPFNAKDLYTLLSMARVHDGVGENACLLGPGHRSLNPSKVNSRRSSFHGDNPDVEAQHNAEVLSSSNGEFADLIEHRAPSLLESYGENDPNFL